MRSRPRAADELALEGKLRELLASVEWLKGVEVSAGGQAKDAGFDLLVTLPLPAGGTAALCVVCKREFRPSAFPILAERTFSPPGHPKVVVPVLALPWVSPRVAELCAKHGWSWYDLAGNCRLDVPGLLHLQRTGNPPVHEVPRPNANLSSPVAGRVVRTLLTPFYAGHRWTQHSLKMLIPQHHTPPVSIGLVNKVVRYLQDEAFIEPLPDRGFKLRDPVKLLEAWRDAYRFERHERRGYFTLLQGKALREALARLDAYAGGFAAYAAFSAGEILAPHVRQSKTWLYVARHELERFVELTQAKPVDSGENIVVLVPDDDGVFFHGYAQETQDQLLPCTNPVQTYVDLWHCGGRGQEAAEAVLEQRLKPAWRAAGLNA